MRRPVAVLALALALAALLALAGCAGPAAEPPPATRTVLQAAGTVEVPVAPRNIVVLDEYSALAMLALGIRPNLVLATLDSRIGTAVLEAEGVPVQQEPGFLSSPDVEKVAATQPDLIVMSAAGPLPSLFAQINGVAPTITLPYTLPWREMLTATGTALDRPAETAALVQRLERHTARVRDGLGGTQPTLSLLFGYGGEIYTALEITPVSSLVTEAGFRRIPTELGLPATQDGTVATLSPETLGAHDADRTVILDGGYYDAATVRSSPAWAGLPVARDGRATDVDGDMWFGSHPFAVAWVLDDLAAVADGRPAGTAADATARWAAFRTG